MALTAKQKREHRRDQRMYGLKPIKKGSKLVWVSAENKNGWSLGLAFNKGTMWLRNMRFVSREEVERALKAAVVFIHLKGSKEELS